MFLLICGAAGSQNYIPFPGDSAYWKTYFYGQSFSDSIYSTFQLTGDTILNGLVYHRVFTTKFEHRLFPSDTIILHSQSFAGGLREQNEIVYFLNANEDTEKAIYNFNLTVGDSVAPPIGGMLVPISILSIDSIQTLDGLYHKKLNLNSIGYATTWYIEGIGNDYGIFPNYGFIGGPGSGPTTLSCFKNHGNLIYYNPSTIENCTEITGIKNLETNRLQLKANPNPFSEECRIDFGAIAKIACIRIVNDKGQLVYEKMIRNSDITIVKKDMIGGDGIFCLQLMIDGASIAKTLIYNSTVH